MKRIGFIIEEKVEDVLKKSKDWIQTNPRVFKTKEKAYKELTKELERYRITELVK